MKVVMTVKTRREIEIAERVSVDRQRAVDRMLWRATGRAANDGRKRLLAVLGVLLTGPVWWAGAFASRLIANGWGDATTGITRPFEYVLTPLKRAYYADHDIGMFGYLMWLWVLTVLLWGYFGGAINRMAATDIARPDGDREDASDVRAFASKHWRTFVGARLAPWFGVAALLGVIVLLSFAGRLPGGWGQTGKIIAVLASIPLASLAVVLASLHTLTGFLQAPTIACEDADLFDALSRPNVYAGAGRSRLVGTRVRYAWGAFAGILWQLARMVGALLLAWACIRVGAGTDGWDRAMAVIKAWGVPPDAERLGITMWDYVVAGTVMLGITALVVFFVGSVIVRVICGRTASYLSLRHAVDGTPTDVIHTPVRATYAMSVESAGNEASTRFSSEPLTKRRV